MVILCAVKDLFFCLGSDLGKDFNFGSASENGDPLATVILKQSYYPICFYKSFHI